MFKNGKLIKKFVKQGPTAGPLLTSVSMKCDRCNGETNSTNVQKAEWQAGWMHVETTTTTDFAVDHLGEVDAVTETAKHNFPRISKGWVCKVCQKDTGVKLLTPPQPSTLPAYEPPTTGEPTLKKLTLK